MGIGLRQNLTILASVRTGDRTRKFLVFETSPGVSARREWKQLSFGCNRVRSLVSVHAVGSGKVESRVDPGVSARRGSKELVLVSEAV